MKKLLLYFFIIPFISSCSMLCLSMSFASTSEASKEQDLSTGTIYIFNVQATNTDDEAYLSWDDFIIEEQNYPHIFKTPSSYGILRSSNDPWDDLSRIASVPNQTTKSVPTRISYTDQSIHILENKYYYRIICDYTTYDTKTGESIFHTVLSEAISIP